MKRIPLNLNYYYKLTFILLVISIFIPIHGYLYFLMLGASFGLALLFVLKEHTNLSFLFYSKSFSIFSLIYLIYPLISILWVQDINHYYKQIRFILLHIMILAISYFFLVKIFTNHKLLFKVLIGIGLTYIVISVWEITTGNHLFLSRYHGVPIPIPTGFYYNENNQTIITSMLLPLVGYFFLTAKKMYQQLFYLAIIVLFIVIAGLAGARISLIISIPFLIYILIRKKSLKIISVLLLSLILVYSFIAINNKQELELALAYLKLQYESIGDEVDNYVIGSTKIRINMISNAVSYFIDSKFIGVGAGNYDYLAKQGNFAKIGWIENTHSYFFELLANFGIIIPLMLLIFLIKLFMNIFVIFKNSIGKDKIQAEMNLFQIPIFFIAGFIPSSFFPIIQVWVIIGYLCAYVFLNQKQLR